MGYPPQAIQSILRLSAQKRFEHAIKDIADAECLYVMADEDGDWSFWGDDDGHTSLAIWSDLEFARLSLAQAGDENLCIFELELEEFLEDGIPYLMDIGSYIAIFPTPDDPETVNMSAIEFAARINKILDESYGEALDLPYLNG